MLKRFGMPQGHAVMKILFTTSGEHDCAPLRVTPERGADGFMDDVSGGHQVPSNPFRQGLDQCDKLGFQQAWHEPTEPFVAELR